MKINIYNFFEKYWLFLPALSTVLLVVSFYPFDFWFLGFIALVPLFYFINFSNKIPFYKIFGAGFLVGAVFSAILSFFTLIQFHWLPETYLFTWMVRLSFIPVMIIGGVFAGAAVVLYRKFRLGLLIDIFIGAAIWVSIEWLIYTIFFGFHFGLLAYVLHKTPLITLASVGGVFFISFLVVLINIFITSILLWSRYNILYPEIYERGRAKHPSDNPLIIFFFSTKRIIFIFLTAFLITGIIYEINKFYLYGEEKNTDSASFAIIQIQDREGVGAFGEFQNNEFSFEKLEKLIKSVNNFKPDFIIYPFSPFNGLLSEKKEAMFFDREAIVGNFENFGKWTEKNVHFDSVFITWNNVFRKGQSYNEYNFWQSGKQIAYYQKRALFPFMDYTPDFAKRIGLYSTPFDASAGLIDQKISFGNLKISNLLCSEVDKSTLAKKDSKWANILLAIGSEAIFTDSIASNFHIIISQFRAAENNRPLIRANRLGPSAIIDNKGKILAKLDYGKEGVLFKKIEYKINPKHTVYSYIGDWGFMGMIWLFLIIVLILKYSKNLRKH